VSSVINPKGSARPDRFSRADEYLFFVFIGEAGVGHHHSDMLRTLERNPKSGEVRWAGLQRSGSNSRRFERPNLFFPLYLDPETGRIVEIGESLPLEKSREEIPERLGLETVWPIRADGGEATWQMFPTSL